MIMNVTQNASAEEWQRVTTDGKMTREMSHKEFNGSSEVSTQEFVGTVQMGIKWKQEPNFERITS
jgi:hypothetical protein